MKYPTWKYSWVMIFKSGILLVFAICILGACKNDIETVRALTDEIDLPDLSGFNIEFSLTDSGILKGKITAPEVYQYIRKEEPYYEFPKGMKAVLYDAAGNPRSYISANYAIYYNQKQLWEGRNQVMAETPSEGKKVETDQMFWNEKEEKIYSDKFTKMTNPDGVFTGEYGFEAEQDLRNWELKGMSGKVYVSDEQSVNNQTP
jgi:LPS export ABC transporter protein LptC